MTFAYDACAKLKLLHFIWNYAFSPVENNSIIICQKIFTAS